MSSENPDHEDTESSNQQASLEDFGPSGDVTENNESNQSDQPTANVETEESEEIPEWLTSPSSTYYVDNKHVQEYLKHIIEENKNVEDVARVKSGTYRQFLTYLDKHDVGLLEVEQAHIQSFLSSKTDVLRDGTLNGKLSQIRELYRYIAAFADEDINMSYFQLDYLEAPSSDLETMEREALDKEEVKLLFSELDTPRNRMMVMIGIELGPRNTAIREIEVSDINFEEKEGEEIAILDQKDDEMYTLPLSSYLTSRLHHWINNIRPGLISSKDNPYLFPARDSERLRTSTSLTEIVREAAEQAGIQDTLGEIHIDENQEFLSENESTRALHRVTPHALRHTFNELLKEKGVPGDVRSRLLNHENTKTTRDFYDDETELTEYRDVMDSLLFQ